MRNIFIQIQSYFSHGASLYFFSDIFLTVFLDKPVYLFLVIIIIGEGIVHLGMGYMWIHSHNLVYTFPGVFQLNNQSDRYPGTNYYRFSTANFGIACDIRMNQLF